MVKLTGKIFVLAFVSLSLGTCISMVQNQKAEQAVNLDSTKNSDTAATATSTPSPTPFTVQSPMASAEPVYITHNLPENAGTMEMATIHEGDFLMGSDDGEADEKPMHKVYLDKFYISKYEVTQAQYKKFTDATKHREPAENWDPEDKGDYPVTNVSWDDASMFCEWAGGKLPSEAEWEKAARGTDARRYPWGNQPEPSCLRVNYNMCGNKTKPVGSYPTGVSPYGIYDAAGNVWEWVADWYDTGYYAVSPASNPQGPRFAEKRVIRGGSASFDVRSLPCANRLGSTSSSMDGSIGFRFAKSN